MYWKEGDDVAGSINRRQIVRGAVLGGVAASALRMDGVAQNTPEASPAVGGWTYTDFRAEIISLATPPTRIAASLMVAAALFDAGVQVDGVFDWVTIQDPEGSSAIWGNLDPASVEILSNPAEGVLDAELAVGFGPDLILTNTWTTPDYYLDQLNPDQIPAIERIAPIGVAIGPEPFLDAVARVDALAALLDAAPDDPGVLAARTEFESTQERFAAVLAERSNLTVSFINFYVPNDGTFWIAGPDGAEDIRYWTNLGLNVIEPEGVSDETGGWVELSVEETLRYPTDILFFSSGISTDLADQIRADPILGQHPAVLAGQLGEWNQGMVVTRPQMTAAMNGVMRVLEGAEQVT